MNVVLYVMDALRADFLSCYGHEFETSPAIDAFAEDAVRYTNAYSTATWTKAAAVSLLTSRHPRSLDMLHQLDVLPEVEYQLPTVLSECGFQTHAVSANTFVSEEFGFSGFDEFTLLQKDPAYQRDRQTAKEDPKSNERRIMDKLGLDEIVTPLSEDVNDELFRILDESRGEDTFAMAWSVDTHGPYFVRGNRSAFGNSQDEILLESEISKENLGEARSLYRDMIRYNDRQFGRLLERLRSEGLYDDTLVILLSDHGESFGDHTSFLGLPIVGHNGVAYEEVIRVPLLIKYPDGRHAGERVDELTQILDVYPTIADVCGVETPDAAEGVSLDPSSPGPAEDRTIFVESHPLPRQVYTGAVRRGDDKLITVDRDWHWTTDPRTLAGTLLWKFAHPSPQLYDLDADPDERENLSGEQSALTGELLAAFEQRRDELDDDARSIEPRRLDEVSEDTEQHLQALGYME